MKTQELEVFEYSPPNAAIIRMPARKFPGYLIAGDSLNELVKTSMRMKDSARRLEQQPESFSDAQRASLISDIQQLTRVLCRMLTHYESVLIQRNSELPYDPPLSIRISTADTQ